MNNRMKETKEMKFLRSVLGYDNMIIKQMKKMREQNTDNLNETTVDCRCKFTEHLIAMAKTHIRTARRNVV
jgi:hypothetical protein